MKTNNRSQKSVVSGQWSVISGRNSEVKNGGARLRRAALFFFLSCISCISWLPCATAQVTTNRIQFRRGLDAERVANVFAAGEPAWSTDTYKLWLGDDATPGGLGVTMDSDLAAALTNLTATLTVWVNGQGFITTVTSNMVTAAIGTPVYPSQMPGYGFITGADATNAFNAQLQQTTNDFNGRLGATGTAYSNQFVRSVALSYGSNSSASITGGALSLVVSGVTGVVFGANTSGYVSNNTLHIQATGGGAAGGGDVYLAGTNNFTGPNTFASSILSKNGVPLATLNDVSNAVIGGMSVFAPTNILPPAIAGSITTGSTVTGLVGRWWPPFYADQLVSATWLTNGVVAQSGTGLTYSIASGSGATLQFNVALTNSFGSGSATSGVYIVSGGLTSTPMLHLDASQMTTLWQNLGKTTQVANDGDPVGTWADQATGGNDAQCSGVTGTFPTYKASQYNGKACIRFDGSANFLQTINNLGITGNSPRTIIFVAALGTSSPTAWNPYLQTGTHDNTNYDCSFCASDAGKFAFHGGGPSDLYSSISCDTSLHVHCVTTDGTTITYSIDGVVVGANSTALSTAVGPVGIFCYPGSVVSPGDACELLIFDSAISDTSVWISTLAAKWGISAP